ncbi:hypothetical protein BD626DRAFT_476848 [Schizophyllum amplum]|uniref:NAD(P)-binding protein n=1 Tax=Schizophyllum amplum TaxID=97359 RepID=A0A550CZP9_9AGAR|nr:hypothetical protein BD626DRAFT_476848 [Auriculariopsis ampla]
MPTALVVGASRGLGLALVHELLSRENTTVYATVRSAPPAELAASGAQILTLDLTDDASIEGAAAQVPALDIIVVNGAMGEDEKLQTTSPERLLEYFNTNVVGVHRIMRAFLPALRKGKETQKKVIFVSSAVGSLEIEVNQTLGFRGPYSVSKAALNMLAVQYHNELCHEGKEGFIVIPLDPGWVDTVMGRMSGDSGMPPSHCAKDITDILWRLKPEDSAKFWRWNGETLSW